MNTIEELEKLIIDLSVMRARLQPRLSYPRAESITMAVRSALIAPTFFEIRFLKGRKDFSRQVTIMSNAMDAYRSAS